MSQSPQEDGNGDPDTTQTAEIPLHSAVDLGDEAQVDAEGQPVMEEVGDPLYAEVKEQDRWLPIANGKCFMFYFLLHELEALRHITGRRVLKNLRLDRTASGSLFSS